MSVGRESSLAAADKLIGALEILPYDESKRPASDQLRMAWPDLGRAWLVQWARELRRDLELIGGELARIPDLSDDEVIAPLENVFWRQGAAREKFYAVFSLAFGVPALHLGEDKRQTISFRPSEQACRKLLRSMQGEHEAARRILDSDGKLRETLLLRHQVAHSLAPLIKAQSLTLYEAGLIRNGGVFEYQALHLHPKGLERLSDIGQTALRARAEALAQRGSVLLASLLGELTALVESAAKLQAPQIIWKAMETGECFLSRADAGAASRAASSTSR